MQAKGCKMSVDCYEFNQKGIDMRFTTLLGAVSLLTLVACQDSKVETETPSTQATGAAVETMASAIDRTATKNAYFGDLHVHSRNSFDAFVFGTRATPDEAYRFAKGETISNGAGHDIKLTGPALDFYSVTDHGEYMGVVPALANPKSALSKTELAQSIFGPNASDPRANFTRIGLTVVSGEEIEEIFDREYMDTVWASTVATTERHNEPGKFTAFAGYEFTSMMQDSDIAAINLHRNVIFKDTAPNRLFSTLDSTNPEDLWNWMNGQRAEGHEVLAIPHNSNASNGLMFALSAYEGGEITPEHSANRLLNEPLVEITQVKGTSEVHPLLSPNDEWADFEQYEYLIGSTEKSTPDAGSFVRNALSRGMNMKNNPYAFGFIGSSDTHLGAASLSEENHFGKFPHDMNPDNRQSTPPGGTKTWEGQDNRQADLLATPQYGASGLAGVWAEANTREDLFDAMRAKETFGTSGPRMKVRMFAGDYDKSVLSAPDMLEQAYARGVPMGSDVSGANGSPNFLAWAAKDPGGISLQRLQMVKVWSAEGEHQEQVIDIACAGGVMPDANTNRCPDNGASVDLTSCDTSADSGAAELKTVWQDPDFKPGVQAAYYMRVLENPKCRWSTWDAVRNGTPPNPNMKSTVQDRAWGSPIWVSGE